MDGFTEILTNFVTVMQLCCVTLHIVKVFFASP